MHNPHFINSDVQINDLVDFKVEILFCIVFNTHVIDSHGKETILYN